MNKTQKYITTLNEKLAGGLKKDEMNIFVHDTDVNLMYPERVKMGKQCYPVGFRFLSSSDLNPSESLGFGEWKLIQTTAFTYEWERME